ncbi:YccF domain-containing protein [Streptantibioticus ferralitis]|uniref:YccF domain-containing protein n=1 Tax=Streptantibioticus ferralitis TaxID=236510 RepID=A0ABT5Z6J3_9ACTN|nr:YccF domain-containing protein [Streptantibioticus ferralitis]MDF2259446.1 YccF domain-containing protein [Streptantibioticus ferralitis]
MKTILNVIWLLLCGIWMAIGYAVAGIVMFVLIITIPWGIAAFRIAGFALWPFGRTTVVRRDAGVGSFLGNLVWLILAGIWLAIGHIVTGIALCLTIIGIPLGIANFKLIPISLTPLGREIVPTDRPFAAR